MEMLTENGVEVDLEALNDLLDRADVLTIGFGLFPERLLMDVRTKGAEGPMVAIVAPVTSVQERYLWLGQNRPSFGAPEAFSFFVWPHTVGRLMEQDVLEPMRRRMSAVSNDGAEVLDRSLATLAELERQAVRAAVRGDDPWRALWERSSDEG